MPSIDEIRRYFGGSVQLMAGRPEGLRSLDLSADGFWRSFSAILVAIPPIALSWVEVETLDPSGAEAELGTATVYLAHALADLSSWLLPILVLMLVARSIGYSRKVGPLVIATNWGQALLAWAFMPYWLLPHLLGPSEGVETIGMILTFASLFLTGRLVHSAIGRDLGAAFAVPLLMILASLICYGAVMDLTGVPLIR